jgi:hypothetical protein
MRLKLSRALLTSVLVLVMVGAQLPGLAQDAQSGFSVIRNSIVKVWNFDANGAPLASGTGFVVDSSPQVSHVLTAAHVVEGNAKVLVDENREVHDIPATVVTMSGDVALLRIDRGGFQPVTFALNAVVVGANLGGAGFYRSDEIGQVARLVFPMTVSAVTSQGRLIAFDNANIQEGLSGGPVFDPGTGSVVGMIAARSTGGLGGFAVSGPVVLYYFLQDQGINALTGAAAPVGDARGGSAPTLDVPTIASPPNLTPEKFASLLTNDFEFDANSHGGYEGIDGRVHFTYNVALQLSGCAFIAKQSLIYPFGGDKIKSIDDTWRGNFAAVAPSSLQVERLFKIRVEAYHSEILHPIWQVSFALADGKPPFGYEGAGLGGADKPTDAHAYVRLLSQADPSDYVVPFRAYITHCAGSRDGS